MEHLEIVGILSERLQELLNAYVSFAPLANLSTKIPTMKRGAVQIFSQQLSTWSDVSHVSTLIQLDQAGAESFLKLAKYAVDFYSKNRNLTTVPFVDNGRPFSRICQLVDCCLEEMERGAIQP